MEVKPGQGNPAQSHRFYYRFAVLTQSGSNESDLGIGFWVWQNSLNLADWDMPAVQNTKVTRLRAGTLAPADDLLVVEEPMEIRLAYGPEQNRMQKSISVTMRTPGQDFELALGFLLTEGIIADWEDVHSIDYCGNAKVPEEAKNVVKVELKPGLDLDLERLQRHFYSSSSCGVCGKASLKAIEAQSCFRLPVPQAMLRSELLSDLPELCRQKQVVFKHTGGIHAAALFSSKGDFIALQEDIGRHNAVDKVIGGEMLKKTLPLSNCVLLLSGRAGFELVQKALLTGIPLLASVGAPSSLAVELADANGLTLAGFVRNQGFNIYTHPERIIFEP